MKSQEWPTLEVEGKKYRGLLLVVSHVRAYHLCSRMLSSTLIYFSWCISSTLDIFASTFDYVFMYMVVHQKK